MDVASGQISGLSVQVRCELAVKCCANAPTSAHSHSEGRSNCEKHAVFTTPVSAMPEMCRAETKSAGMSNPASAWHCSNKRGAFRVLACARRRTRLLLSGTSLDYGYDCETGNTHMPWLSQAKPLVSVCSVPSWCFERSDALLVTHQCFDTHLASIVERPG
jgi:hypothetical protein